MAAERGPLVTVVGGGIAGLVAAIAARENGAEVRLYERRPELGGRARSSAGPWIANFGPHGFLRGGPAHRWLKARGLAPNLASISPARTRFHFQGKLRRNLPFAITARTVAGARRAAPNDLTFSAWAASEFGKHTAVALTGLAGASFSYHHEPGELAADFVWTRLQRLFLPPAVHRVVGGWSTIIGLLAVHADRRGVVIETGHRIEHLPDPPVVVATELRDAGELLGRPLTWPTAGGVALDLGLEKRRGDPETLLDLDDRTFVQGQPKSAAPAGHLLLQIHVSIRPGEEATEAQRRVEPVLEAAYPGWQSRLAHRRRMVVAGRVGAVESPSQTWQERPAIRQGEGVFLAGDMVAAPGVLSEIAFASGQEAGALAASWATTAER